AGFQVIMTEIARPTVIRRAVAFAQAVYSGTITVEGVSGSLAHGPEEALQLAREGKIAVLVDPRAEVIKALRPQIVVDAILAKANLGTSRDQAPIVIALGPGFTAGRDAHAVVETKRGHYLGRVIWQGEAIANTGTPGEVMGYAGERVLRAPAAGIFRGCKAIGDPVTAGETVARVNDIPVTAKISGVLRGILHDGLEVTPGMKAGDIDPRGERDYCFTISDKARAIAGGVLEAILHLQKRSGEKPNYTPLP
ncbi:MAG: EF2563 family selenium-dependent molybdenum hydroxylase system protein, partial [Moorella sp. (in: Bacteria)]|nr:EF2563 family selenium-dependent molybdenum hydroxylase system protein [Moorella sp. (in: firmicutes)]